MKRKPFYTPNPTRTEYRHDQQRAAKALGRRVKRPHVVHHHTPTQLVICENQAYHMLLHRRTVAVKFGYDPNVYAACYCCQKPYPVDEKRPTRKFCPACSYDYSVHRPSYSAEQRALMAAKNLISIRRFIKRTLKNGGSYPFDLSKAYPALAPEIIEGAKEIHRRHVLSHLATEGW